MTTTTTTASWRGAQNKNSLFLLKLTIVYNMAWWSSSMILGLDIWVYISKWSWVQFPVRPFLFFSFLLIMWLMVQNRAESRSTDPKVVYSCGGRCLPFLEILRFKLSHGSHICDKMTCFLTTTWLRRWCGFWTQVPYFQMAIIWWVSYQLQNTNNIRWAQPFPLSQYQYYL